MLFEQCDETEEVYEHSDDVCEEDAEVRDEEESVGPETNACERHATGDEYACMSSYHVWCASHTWCHVVPSNVHSMITSHSPIQLILCDVDRHSETQCDACDGVT